MCLQLSVHVGLFSSYATPTGGPGSIVSIATGYGLGGPGIKSRWGRDFPHLFCPVAHPASCTMGTGPFPGVKSGRGVTLTPHPLLVPWSELYLYFPYGPYGLNRPSVPVRGCTLPHPHVSVFSLVQNTPQQWQCAGQYCIVSGG